MTKSKTTSTPLLPDFHLKTLRKSPRSAQQKRREDLDKLASKRLDHLADMLKDFVPLKELEPANKGLGSRERLYSKVNTFWAFLQQVWSEDGSCQEAVHRIIEQAQAHGIKVKPSTSTSAYVQARKRLDLDTLWSILYHGAGAMELEPNECFPESRPWILVDGTSFSMPDTESNQEEWPQPSNQKPGIGFPVMKAVATFSLGSGAILDAETGNQHEHELMLFRQMYESFSIGDILLGDRGFCGWQMMVELQQKRVDSVFRLHGMRKPVSKKDALSCFSDGDLLIEQKRPQWREATGVDKEEWKALPEKLTLRQISFKVETPGFRSETIHLVTTLLDAETYPKEFLMEMYLRRWKIEVVFRDIKISMDWDLMRCKSPEMVRREFVMMLIGYNAIRYLQLQAAHQAGLDIESLSFKSSLQVIRIWERRFRCAQKEKRNVMALLLEQIASVLIPERPNRAEPRVKKRRPKKAKLMTRPRAELKAEMLRKQAA